MVNEAFWGVSILRIHKKTLSQISYSKLSLSSTLKVSKARTQKHEFFSNNFPALTLFHRKLNFHNLLRTKVYRFWDFPRHCSPVKFAFKVIIKVRGKGFQ